MTGPNINQSLYKDNPYIALQGELWGVLCGFCYKLAVYYDKVLSMGAYYLDFELNGRLVYGKARFVFLRIWTFPILILLGLWHNC